jgi:hypothetical protein
MIAVSVFPQGFRIPGGTLEGDHGVRWDPRDVQLPAQYFPRGLQCHRRPFPEGRRHAVHLAEPVRVLPAKVGFLSEGPGASTSTSLVTFLT